MTFKKYLLCLITFFTLFLNFQEVKAQQSFETYRPTPLDSFLVANVDTVFILSHTSNFGIPPLPNAYLTKKKDTISLFKYDIPYHPNTRMPSRIAKLLFAEHQMRNYYSSRIKLSRYFLPVNIPNNEVKELWISFMAMKPLGMQDDTRTDNNCYKQEAGISDAGGLRLTMLTKKEVRHFYFSAPAHYEKFCPGNPGRVTILAIEKLISKYVNLKIFY